MATQTEQETTHFIEQIVNTIDAQVRNGKALDEKLVEVYMAD
jgi:hypothetical protein